MEKDLQGKIAWVTGDLVMTGDAPRLDFGADTFDPSIVSSSIVFPHGDTDGAPFVLTVGGDLFLGPGGRIDLYAAVTNGASASDFGGWVAVGGLFTVSSNAVVYSNNHFLNGAAFALEAGSVLIQTNGVISADSRGFSGGPQASDGYGPGRGKGGSSGCISAGHGGAGSNAGGAYGQAYDDIFRPGLAGSGGGGFQYEYPGGMGGGYIYLKVNGKLTLGGTITANAIALACRAGTGAGGGILIDARRFAVEPGAVLSARGGDNTTLYSGSYGLGAGGIIAVWTGHAYTGARNRRSARELGVPAGLTVDVSAGAVPTGPTGEPGSAKFLNLNDHLVIFLR